MQNHLFGLISLNIIWLYGFLLEITLIVRSKVLVLVR